MRHVNDVAPGVAILFQHGADVRAGLGDVGDGEKAVVVFVLGVDDDVDAVLGGRVRGRDTEEGAERFSGLDGFLGHD